MGGDIVRVRMGGMGMGVRVYREHKAADRRSALFLHFRLDFDCEFAFCSL
jgi:hypothetical protein